MKIIIAGAGAVGTHLAKLFSRERHDITLIDDNPERLEGIGSNFEMLTICDSPSSIETLKGPMWARPTSSSASPPTRHTI